jgi:hypothetical protein
MRVFTIKKWFHSRISDHHGLEAELYPSQLQRMANVGSLLLVLSSVFIVAYLIYDAYCPWTVIRFNDDKIPIAWEYAHCNTTYTFESGDVVPLRFRGEKFTDDTPTIYRRIVNDIVRTLPDSINPKDVGKFDFVSFGYVIPNEVPSGTYFFEMQYVYDINVLRKVTIKKRSESFRVNAPKHPDKEQDIKMKVGK